MATELGAAALLRSAARLIERALIKLDVREVKCEKCSLPHYENKEHAHAYKQLTDTPHKLERWADVLDEKPDAVKARAERNAIDHRIKHGRR